MRKGSKFTPFIPPLVSETEKFKRSRRASEFIQAWALVE